MSEKVWFQASALGPKFWCVRGSREEAAIRKYDPTVKEVEEPTDLVWFRRISDGEEFWAEAGDPMIEHVILANPSPVYVQIDESERKQRRKRGGQLGGNEAIIIDMSWMNEDQAIELLRVLSPSKRARVKE